MRKTWLFLFVLLAWPAAQARSIPGTSIGADGTEGPIGARMTYLADTAATLTVEQAARSGDFRPCTSAVPGFGLGKNAYWLRFTVSNATADPSVSLAIPYSAIDELDVFVRDGEGFTQVARSGLSRDAQDGELVRRGYVFELPVPSGTEKEVYLRARAFKHLHVPVIIGSAAAINRSITDRAVGFSAYAGIMLVLAIYNLFVFFSIRDKTYFFYVLSTVTLCATQLSLQGYGPFDFLHWSGWWTARAPLVFNLLTIPLGLEFARRFINTKAYVPFLHRWTPLFYGLLAITTGIYLLVDPWLGQALGNALSGICALYLLTMTIISVVRGSRQARFFLLGWTGFLVGVILFVMKDEGAIPFSAMSVYSMPIGSALEGILLSFGLADRITILRREKEQSQAEALASAQENARITRDQNVILEQKVTERTEQLQLSLDQLKQAQSQLVEAEKMSSLGQLTAGIAHEINNPINYIRSNIPPLKRDMADLLEVLGAYRAHGAPQNVAALEQKLGLDETIVEVNDILHSMEEGANRTAEIVRGLRSFSRLDEGDLKAVDVNDGIRSTLNILGTQLNDHVNVELDLRAVEALECFPGKLNQVFMNMLNNAIQAVVSRHGTDGGRIQVITEQAEGHTVISILDNGMGMKPEVRARVFEPFFTTKAIGEGTGLGLSIAHSIIEKHNGRIEVDSVENEGSIFRIILPNQQPMAMAKRA
jgi:two-component system NtrC family sensor kinase